MFREQQGKVVAVADHSFCFGELERATAILEHFVDLVARGDYDSWSESYAPPIMASSACILISCPFFLASF